MYIDTSHITRAGNTYTRHLLRESYRANGTVLHRTMANVSQGSEAEIEAMRLALRHKEALAHLGTLQDAITLTHGRSFGAVWTVSHIARRLGIAQALGTTRAGTLALWHVLARVLDQGSRLSAVRLAMSHAACDVLGVDSCEEDTLYEHLDWLAGAQALGEDRLCAQRPTSKPVSLFLSDVPSRYLEGPPNALAAFGDNRDGKQGTRPIVIGLLCDEDGHPISIEVFPGHTPDPHTVAAQVAQRKERCGVHAITCVGDRGMSKSQHIEDLARQGCPSMTAITQPQMEKLLRTGTFPMELFAQELAEVLTEEGLRSVRRRNPVRAQEVRENRQAQLAPLQALVTQHHPYLQAHPRADAQRAWQQVVARAITLRRSDGVALTFTERPLTLPLNVDAQTEAAQLDGGSVLKTDLTPVHAPQELVQDRSTDLASVAHACRACKPVHLEVRPICLRLEARTRAHAFVVMVAYQIMRYLASCWKAFDVTVEEGLHALTTLWLVAVSPHNAPSSHGIPTPRDAIARFLHRADLKLPKAFSLSGTHVSTKKKRQSERLGL